MLESVKSLKKGVNSHGMFTETVLSILDFLESVFLNLKLNLTDFPINYLFVILIDATYYEY